jgi:P4 family phage/plasmid primase-like protien
MIVRIAEHLEDIHWLRDVTYSFERDDAILKVPGDDENHFRGFDTRAIRETLTLRDGVLDFSGLEMVFKQAKPDEYRRHFLPYSINEVRNAVQPERFMKFMRDNFHNADTLETLMQSISTFASRNAKLKRGFFFIGRTNTGKTATLDILQNVYAGMFEPLKKEVLIGGRNKFASGNEATPELAKLEGKGAAIAQELDKNDYLNHSLWKSLTGGDRQTARGLFSRPHNFEPTAQIVIASNYAPNFDTNDQALVKRLVVIPFNVEHDPDDKATEDPDSLIERMRPEFPAIVKLFAEKYIELKQVYRKKIQISTECRSYTQNYIEAQDTELTKFVTERVEFSDDESVFTPIKEVYEDYTNFYIENNNGSEEDIIPQNKFTRYFLRDYGRAAKKKKSIEGQKVNVFVHVKLRESAEWEAPPIARADPVMSGSPPPEKNPWTY